MKERWGKRDSNPRLSSELLLRASVLLPITRNALPLGDFPISPRGRVRLGAISVLPCVSSVATSAQVLFKGFLSPLSAFAGGLRRCQIIRNSLYNICVCYYSVLLWPLASLSSEDVVVRREGAYTPRQSFAGCVVKVELIVEALAVTVAKP